MIKKPPKKTPKIFYCKNCDYTSNNKKDYDRHLQTKKHNDNNATKNPYFCFCGKKYKYLSGIYRHKLECKFIKNLDDKKHVAFYATNATYKKPQYICDCGKIYQYHSSFYRHKKICNFVKSDNLIVITSKISNENQQLKDLIKELIISNKELQEDMIKVVKEPKIVNNNTTNNTQFNIMNYLNNECKDAMNLSDFIDEFTFSLDDLEIMGTKGYQQSMEETFVKQLRDMDKNKRPIHCSDKKRKSFYIKDNDIWEKDEDNSKIVTGFKKISQKHLGILSTWTNYNKNWSYNERKQDFFNKSVQEVAKYNDLKQINKIINKLTGLTIK
jgi:hypothetical protein